MNWYSKNEKNRLLSILASVNKDDRPYIDSQLLLQKIALNMPENHPLKGKAYIAGGAVRDELLGKIPKDIDITVEAPEGGIKLAQYIANLLGLREPVIFPTFGTARIVLKNGVEVEFVQTRKEQYHEGSRKPETSFGSIKEDVERRDFTINSLLKNLESGPSLNQEEALQKVQDGEILDLTGMGVKDIDDGIIRTPLSPDIIFSEDPLRMMRAIRFAAKYGWKIEDQTLDGIVRNSKKIDSISKERVRDELDKIIGYGKLHVAIPVMQKVGLLDKVLPEMSTLIGVEQSKKYHSEGDAYIHTINAIKTMETRNPGASVPLVWAMLAHDWGKKLHFYRHEESSPELAEKRMRELKYPNEVIEKVKRLVANHMRHQGVNQWTPKSFRKFYRDMGDDYEDVLKVMEADEIAAEAEEKPEKYNHQILRERMPEMLVEKMPAKSILNGNEVLEMLRVYKPDIKPGPHVGQVNKLQTDIMLEDPTIVVENPELTKENMRQKLLVHPEFKRIVESLKNVPRINSI